MTALDDAPLVLVVDDEPEILSLVGELLEELGLRVLVTAEPDDALELAVAHRPALVLLDVMMRGTDGYTLATRLHGDPRTTAIPLVFMTGQEASMYRTLSFGVGAVAHVQKPFTLGTLRAAVSQALGV
jgi:CheY-like chemotaxis protein